MSASSPILRVRAEQTTQRWPVRIYTLGRFEIYSKDQPLRFLGKVQRRPLALLKAVIAFGGQHVPEDKLLHALWPGADASSARFSLTSAIHRLRRLLDHDEAIVRRAGKIGINPEHAWVDLWALEALLDRIEDLRDPAGERKSAVKSTFRWIKQAGELYRGAFLGTEGQSPWAIPVAEHIRRRLLRQLVRAGRLCEELEEWEDAIGYYEKAFAIDASAEDVCRCLMKIYYRLGRRIDVVAVYNECRQTLRARLRMAPSAKTEALFKKVIRTELAPL